MSSEGVGSYWPFATDQMLPHADLLLKQIESTPKTRYILVPNQHIGAWKVGFMPQWLARDYLARRGSARFKPDQIVPARCPLLGYSPRSMRIEGSRVTSWFLQVDTQPEVGEDGYDRGAAILREFFHQELKQYLAPGLSALGRRIIECCLDDGDVEDFAALIPVE